MRGTMFVSLLLACGCASMRTTVVNERGLVHETYGYRVASADPWTFISEDWRVESHEADGNAIGDQKTSSDHVYTVSLDLEGDGTDEPLNQAPYYDLRLDHRRNNGRIWLRTFPIPDSVQDKDLQVLVENFVENIAAEGYYTAGVSAGHLVVQSRTYATKMLDTQRIGVSQQDAAAVLFDVANVNQLQMSADARAARAMVVMIRTPYEFTFSSARGRRSWPVLMLAGYANAPADFDGGLEDFKRFLQSIDLRRPGTD